MEERKNFWKIWGKFVGLLLVVLALWILLIFICDKVLGKTFEELKYIHYFILLVVIIKAKKWFLKKLDEQDNEEKEAEGTSVRTDVEMLDEAASVEELARLLGGANVTERVMESAKELKELAKCER